MKNVLLAVNALLVVAVGFLLYKQFSGTGHQDTPRHIPVAAKDPGGKKVLFAYIVIDSIQQKYELAKSVKKELAAKEAAVNAEIEKMERAYNAKLSKYQEKGASMTPQEADAARQDMDATQRQMSERIQSLKDEYNTFNTSKILSVRKKIEDFLNDYNADKTYSFIFSYEPGLFFYRDTAYDITADVLKGLNEDYKKK